MCRAGGLILGFLQETMNFWRQTNHIMSYFKEENFRGEKRLPSNFITGFLEVSVALLPSRISSSHTLRLGSQLDYRVMLDVVHKANGRKKNPKTMAVPLWHPESPVINSCYA